MYQKIIEELETLAEPDFAEWVKPFLGIKHQSKKFHPSSSTGKGLRSEDEDALTSDIVLGVRVPKLRKLSRLNKEISEDVLLHLLHSQIHEARALALFIMLHKVKKEPQKICKIYLDNLEYINNWDLIDYTAPYIVAPYGGEKILRDLADSKYMWANRVAMVSTIYFIKQGDFRLALEFAEKFITHPHHLIHKASGWMLREVGKKNSEVLIDFLDKHSSQMPSVMRSYAREKLK